MATLGVTLGVLAVVLKEPSLGPFYVLKKKKRTKVEKHLSRFLPNR